MKFKESQASIEKYLGDHWSGNNIVFENEPLEADLYDEYASVVVAFGGTDKRAIENCYKVIGLLIVTVNVRPGVGISRALELANTLSPLLASYELPADPSLSAPVVQFVAPSLSKVQRPPPGWVQAQVSCPFYYFVFI